MSGNMMYHHAGTLDSGITGTPQVWLKELWVFFGEG